MKTIFLFLLCLFSFGFLHGQSSYQEAIHQGDAALKRGEYKVAINKYFAAEAFDPSMGEVVKRKINDVFDRIQRLKRQAEADRKNAINAQELAENRARRATANDLAYKAENVLKEGDRTTAFRLAEFAYHYVYNDNNSNAAQAISNAHYYNNHSERLVDYESRKAWQYSFIGHRSSIRDITFSPDNIHILSGDNSGMLKLWDSRSGQEVYTFEGHNGYIRSVAFSPDGRYALSAGEDMIIKLWEVDSGKKVRIFEGHSKSINSIAFAPDGKHIISGSSDGTVKLWEVDSGTEIRTFLPNNGYFDYIFSVDFSPDGRYILGGGGDGIYNRDYSVRLWEVASGLELYSLKGHTDIVYSVDFSPNGRYIVSGGSDNTIKLWEATSGKLISNFEGHSDYISSVTFSPDSEYILSGSADSILKLWEVNSGVEIRSYEGHTAGITSVAISPDSKYLLSGSHDFTLKLWEVDSKAEASTYTGHTGAIESIAISPNGRYALSGSLDSTIKLWNIEYQEEIYSLKGHNSLVKSVAFSPDGRYAMSGSWDTTLKLWEVQSGQKVRSLESYFDSTETNTSSYSDEYDYGIQKIVHVGNEVYTIEGYNGSVTSVAFSPDGEYALSGHIDKILRLWDIKSGKEIRSFQGHASHITSAVFSSDGKYILSGSGDHTLKLWEVQSGQEVYTLKGHRGPVESVAFSPDKKYIASGSGDSTLKLWEVKNGREVRSFEGHNYGINSVAFSPNGNYIVSSSGDKTLKVWDIQSGRQIRSLVGHTSYVSSVTFSPDGKYILSGSGDGTLILWKVETDLILKQHKYSLAALTPQQLQIYGVVNAIDSTQGAWEAVLANEGSIQLHAFALYFTDKVASNNNPAIFNAYYERAEQCYARAYELSSNPVYQRELHRIYLAWSDKLWQARDWSVEAALLQKGMALDYERVAFYPRWLHTLLLQGQYAEAEAQWAAWQTALRAEEQEAFRTAFLEDYEGLKERAVLSGEMEKRYSEWLKKLEEQ